MLHGQNANLTGKLDVAQFMDDATGFLAEDHGVFWFSQILPNRIRV